MGTKAASGPPVAFAGGSTDAAATELKSRLSPPARPHFIFDRSAHTDFGNKVLDLTAAKDPRARALGSPLAVGPSGADTHMTTSSDGLGHGREVGEAVSCGPTSKAAQQSVGRVYRATASASVKQPPEKARGLAYVVQGSAYNSPQLPSGVGTTTGVGPSATVAMEARKNMLIARMLKNPNRALAQLQKDLQDVFWTDELRAQLNGLPGLDSAAALLQQ